MRCHNKLNRFGVLRWLTAILELAVLLSCHSPPGSRGYAPDAAVVPDADFSHLFAAHGDGWTGGDGTISIRLPDGRSLWLFGDSFIGGVKSDGTRDADTPFIRNCALIQSEGRLTPLYGRGGGAPDALFPLAAAGEWYWPGDGTVQGNRLFVFLHRFRQTGTGLWDWQWAGTDLALLGLPDLGLDTIRTLPFANGVRYGATILEHQSLIYIYGVVEGKGGKQLHVARTNTRSFAEGAWLFFDGDQWSPSPERSASVLNGVGSQFSLIPYEQAFVLITMDGRTPFSGRLVAYKASRPEGPFQGPVFLYKAPEANSNLAAYNPFIHPQFTRQGRLLISYNVNHLHDPDALYRDAQIYRPRFIRLDLAQFLPSTPEVEHQFGGRWGWGTSRRGRR
jgi:hypothetical protein